MKHDVRYGVIFPNFKEYARACNAPGTIDCHPERIIFATEEQLEYFNKEKINFLFWRQ